MAVRLTEEQIDFGKALMERGFTYYDISIEYYQKFGIYIHPESVRYYLTRKDKPKLSTREKLEDDGIEKILVLSDLHVPYNRDDLLDIVAKHKDEISMIVFNGDIIDCKPISKYNELGRGSLSDEMARCHEILKQINDMTPNVKKVLVQGNHEIRLAKYMATNPSELNDLHTDNVLREIVEGFKVVNHEKGQVTYFGKLDNYEVLDTWYFVDRGVVYCHPISFSKIPARTAYNAVEYFVRNGFDFNTCLVAHTHHYGACRNLGKYCVETGSLCAPQPYASTGKLTFVPQDSGYHLVVLKNGKYDVNLSRNYLLDD